ncbi:MAG: tetratricopeptide repeat protein [Verrucomicrobiales bacterium]
MKIPSIFSLSLALTLGCLAQDEADKAPQDPPAAEPQIAAWQQAISNLPVTTRRQYFVHAREADSLFKQKRIFECLDELAKLKAIYPDNPATLNLEGACYVEFRDFEKARQTFEKALALSPGNPNVKFNLAEIKFVTHQWQEAHDALTPLAEPLKDADQGMHHLVLYKIALCKLKLDQVAEAKELLAPYDFLDDTPLFYFAEAAFAYQADKAAEAEGWLARAARVYRDPQALAPWQDTLIEFGYIKSFYGGDLEGDTRALPGTEAATENAPQP